MAATLSSAEAVRFGRFLLVGLLNTAVGYALFALFLLASDSTLVAAVGSTVLGALFNFRSIGALVFGDRNGVLGRFLTVYAVQCLANIALLRLAAAAGVGPLIAEILILPLLAVASFLAMRGLVFARESGA